MLFRSCPAEAILPDTEDGLGDWLEINTRYAAEWPNITVKGESPADAEEWKDKPGKKEMLSTNPGAGS